MGLFYVVVMLGSLASAVIIFHYITLATVDSDLEGEVEQT